MSKRRAPKIKDASPLNTRVSAKRYLEAYRNLPYASEHFMRLTDLLIKIVDAHKARDALQESMPFADERIDVRFLLEEGLRHLRLAEHFFYRAYENDDLIREERQERERAVRHGNSNISQTDSG